jgi:hypothetical protein
MRGEAGIGKTRVVEEFQALAENAGFACHVGLVLDFGAGIGPGRDSRARAQPARSEREQSACRDAGRRRPRFERSPGGE